MLAKTVSRRDAATEFAVMHSQRVLASMSVSCIKLPHMGLGVAQMEQVHRWLSACVVAEQVSLREGAQLDGPQGSVTRASY